MHHGHHDNQINQLFRQKDYAGLCLNQNVQTVQYFVYSIDGMSLSTDVWKKLRTTNPAISLHICG